MGGTRGDGAAARAGGMTDALELSREGIEHAHHAAHHGPGNGDRHAIRSAVLIAILAAVLGLAEMSEKGAQSAFLAHHIQASDDWNFFQTKHVRSNLFSAQADLLESLPGADSPAVRAKIAAARATAARLEDDPASGEGRKQLAERAKHREAERDHEAHRYHQFELVVWALQIGIVLASVSVVTRVRLLAYVGAGFGALAAGYGLLIGAGLG